MTWFETLTGFAEQSPRQVRENIAVDGDRLTSRVNGKSFVHGLLETPSLAELRERVRSTGPRSGRLSVREVVADVRQLHTDPSNAGSLFQVASQFNLLEMTSPEVTPEHGVGRYENDHTQGPACAIAAGAGTIYRNYFAPAIDCLADMGNALGNSGGRLWEMRNGYALASRAGLEELAGRIQRSSESQRDELRRLLRIGVQWNTQVTLDECQHTVSQAYCSALPVTYSNHPAPLWAGFAGLVLEAAYEATLCAAILNSAAGGNNRLFLTLLGGGAFGNDSAWILGAIRRALSLYQHAALDVAIVRRSLR